MNTFNRLKIVKHGDKQEPKHNFKFLTSCDKEIALLEKLRSKGYLITVIKSIEYSVTQYLLKTNQLLTIHSIMLEGNSVNVTFFKNNDYHVLTIPKALLATGSHNYEYSIGCAVTPKVVDKDSDSRMFRHPKKKDVLYVSL